MSDEPQIHSHYEDSLPKSHKYAYKTLYCPVCNKMLHCGSNECMITWVEWFEGFSCFNCFVLSQPDKDVLSDERFKHFIGDYSAFVR